MAETDPPAKEKAATRRRQRVQGPLSSKVGEKTLYRSWGWVGEPISPDAENDVFLVKIPKGSKEDEAAVEIYLRVDRDLAVEEARADRLLRLYGL